MEFKQNQLEHKYLDALLVAPAESKEENTYYVDDTTTQTVVCDMVGEKTYSVSSEAAMDKKVVTAKSAIADKVVVDGKELSELTERPTLNTMTQKCVL